MKRTKKLLAAALALCLAVTALVIPASAADISTFSDITDPTVAQAVEVLRMMGVLNGVGNGVFNPEGTLTRAEFCKMAVLTMGLGEQVPSYETRTIFPDVAYNHWARGYINLAVTTEVEGSRLILGVGNGNFAPSRVITYGEAVTVILRVLGYGSAAAVNWPAGAVATVGSLGLSRSLGAVTATGPITRAQAAILFNNMLTTEVSDGSGIYASTLGTATANSVITSVSATTADGSKGVKLSTLEAAVKPAFDMPPSFLLGRRGTAVLDKRGRFLTFIPDSSASSRSFNVSVASGTHLIGTDGTNLVVPADAKVMYSGVQSTYAEAYKSLNRAGLPVTVYFTAAGAVDYIYAEGFSSISGRVAVAESGGRDAFLSIIPNSNCTVMKNGSAAGWDSIRQNDVGIYDESRNTLYVTDFRVTSVYEGAKPSAESPSEVTILGRDIELADCAIETIDKVRTGTLVTALFSPDGKIARLVPASTLNATAMAVLAPESSGSSVTLELINAPAGLETVTGTLPSTTAAELFKDQVVSFQTTLSDSGAHLSLTSIPSAPTGSLDLSSRRVGNTRLSQGVTVFERVGAGGDLTRISLTDLSQTTVPMGQVVFTHKNEAGEADVLILNDVTGDRYTYGIITTRTEQTSSEADEEGKVTSMTHTITTVTNSQGSLEVVGGGYFPYGYGGIAATGMTVGNVGGYRSAAGFASLTRVTGVTQADFDLSLMTVKKGSAVMTIAPNVQCYNQRTGTWYEDLESCFLATDSFSVYYDRSLDTGGKIRLIVIE